MVTGRSGRIGLDLPASKSRNNLFAVESAVFNKDFARVISTDDNSGNEDTRYIAFVRLWIHRGLIGCGVQGDPE